VSGVAAIGIDAGSTTCKLVAVDREGAIVGSRLEQTEPRIEVQVQRMLEATRAELGVDGEVPSIATGYGRKLIKEATRNLTEITCHARGVFRDLGRAGTLIDIGGQDSKVIQIGDDGRPVDFMMNDKCAAGTGRFLEYTAARLGVPVEELGERARSFHCSPAAQIQTRSFAAFTGRSSAGSFPWFETLASSLPSCSQAVSRGTRPSEG
jgi:predicted CoA-substrate-specific enzyme activase